MRLEPALEVVGALKRRFGEPMTVTDICRLVPLSYQPVYEYVRGLAKAQAVSLRKEGQRLLCEPAATAAGSLWLAQWSVRELQTTRDPLLRELAEALEGRIRDHAAIAACDLLGRGRIEVYLTEARSEGLPAAARVQVVSPDELADCLRGPDGLWALARRIVPVVGHQQFWALALTAREQAAGRVVRPERTPVRRRSVFID
ncbi:MAG: hypothetical protein FJX75_03580 [Armatimonadetes bacterium]|nr:hypothetical protein [Armatimonadota bacterium]